MVAVDMGIAGSMDKIATFETADLGDHHRQKGVGGYIERHSEEDIGASLI